MWKKLWNNFDVTIRSEWYSLLALWWSLALVFLVHAFVASRVDYCGSLLIGAPKKTTDKLQRVLNAATRIISNTRKFDRGLSQFRRRDLHWLDVDDRVRFRVCVSRCTSVYTTWRSDICRHSANLCPAFLVVVTYARLVVANWTFPVSIWPRTGDGRLPTPVPHLGTLYLTVSRTLILLSKHSNAISRPSYFPHTSTFSAFEVLTKTRYINPLLLN